MEDPVAEFGLLGGEAFIVNKNVVSLLSRLLGTCRNSQFQNILDRKKSFPSPTVSVLSRRLNGNISS
jgi:hypothetical protein